MSMRIRLRRLLVRTRQTIETVEFTAVTFLHGPVGTGKSTVARLIDYCFGGELERTPAIQKEFVAAELVVELGGRECIIERAANDTQSVRVTWQVKDGSESMNAPLDAQSAPIFGDDVFGLSDLLFHLCGITPIKVRKNRRDPDAKLVRLSFRDIWVYCYLDQTHLDSSFFRLREPFRERKSQDAMRFFTGLHSDRYNMLEQELAQVTDEQRVKRESVGQIRTFMARFELGSEIEMSGQVSDARRELNAARQRKDVLEQRREVDTHPTDDLRQRLRQMGSELEGMEEAIADAKVGLEQQRALRAELITAKTKAQRAEHAGQVLQGVNYKRCPQCGTDISIRPHDDAHCHLCGSDQQPGSMDPMDTEALRRDLNERIDQIGDALNRRGAEILRMERYLEREKSRKLELDRQLQEELARYDSSFVESIRDVERAIATLVERIRSLEHLRQMPAAITALEEEAGSLQGKIDGLRSSLQAERGRLEAADANVAALKDAFKRMLLAVRFPGVVDSDEVVIDTRNWEPYVQHGDQIWGFWDTGSGGKKTLFNVCYALALHMIAVSRGLPVPTVLVIDSPTKNISELENPALIRDLYVQAYQLAGLADGAVQLLLIDSNMVLPTEELDGFTERRMAGEESAPALIPYYNGP
ncbi:MAG: hypothetical protein JWR07_1736 [Nevskia sp.]|nr:hypothetical protein [Nevskia sp.]